jgi:hypothetical protein
MTKRKLQRIILNRMLPRIMSIFFWLELFGMDYQLKDDNVFVELVILQSKKKLTDRLIVWLLQDWAITFNGCRGFYAGYNLTHDKLVYGVDGIALIADDSTDD